MCRNYRIFYLDTFIRENVITIQIWFRLTKVGRKDFPVRVFEHKIHEYVICLQCKARI